MEREPRSSPPKTPAVENPYSLALGGIYHIVNTSVVEGKNILKLIPVSASSVQSTAAKASISSPSNVSIQSSLSNNSTVPLVHFQVNKNAGFTNKTNLPGLAQNVAVVRSASSLHVSAVPMDKPLLQNSAVSTPLPPPQRDNSCMLIKSDQFPVTVRSPVLPSGHHLQIPAHAEVKSMPACYLPPAIQQKILAAAAGTPSGMQGEKIPTVIYVSPVNTVKTEVSKHLPTLYPKPQLSNHAPRIVGSSQESRNCPAPDVNTSHNQTTQGSPMKWVVHDSPQSEAQCLMPVKSSNNMASEILKTLADMKKTDISESIMSSLCANSTSAIKTKFTPIKENALVMYNGKVYLLAKKGMDALTTDSEKTGPSNIKTVDKPADAFNSDSLNQISRKVLDMVLTKNKPMFHDDQRKTCLHPEIVLQPKENKSAILSQPVSLYGNQENCPRIVSTIRMNTNGKCTVKPNYPGNNSSIAISESSICEDRNYAVKTHSSPQVLQNLEEMSASSKLSNLTSDNLGKGFGFLKEMKVNLKRIPYDLIECYSRKTEDRLKCGITSGKEDEATFERKVHGMKKQVTFAFKPEICKNNMGFTQTSKREEITQKDVNTAKAIKPTLHPTESHLLQQTAATLIPENSKKKTEIQDNVDNKKRAISKEAYCPPEDKEAAKNSLPITSSLCPKVFELVTADLKLAVTKECESPILVKIKNESIEQCTATGIVENSSISPPILNQTLLLNSNVLRQQTSKDAKKRKFMFQDIENPKRRKSIEGDTNNNVVPTSNSLPLLEQNHLKSLQISQQVVDLVPNIHKEKQSKPFEDMESKKRNRNEEACTLSKESETTNIGLPILQPSYLQSSKEYRVTAELQPSHENERELKLLHSMLNPETLETEKECPINQDLTLVGTNQPSLHQPSSHSSSLLQVKSVSSPSTSTIKEVTNLDSGTQPWKSTWSSERHMASSSNFLPVPQVEFDETIREERIRRLKDLLKEKEQALEAIRKTMKTV